MLMFLMLACDELRTPCAEIDGAEVVIFGQCPEKEAVEISSINVFDGDLAVMWAVGTTERRAIASVVYGEPPAGWDSSIGPTALVPGETYGVDVSFFDAPKASLDFVAP